MKLYVYRICYDNSIYAYTANKTYAKMFEEQRSREVFSKSTVDMDQYEFMVFCNQNKSLMLQMDVLTDGEVDIDFCCTVDESDRLSSSSDYILKSCETNKHDTERIEYNKNILESILFLTDILITSKNGISHLAVNTLKLFFHIFKFTFRYSEDGEEYIKYNNTEEI